MAAPARRSARPGPEPGTLTVRVEGAFALELQHLGPAGDRAHQPPLRLGPASARSACARTGSPRPSAGRPPLRPSTGAPRRGGAGRLHRERGGAPRRPRPASARGSGAHSARADQTVLSARSAGVPPAASPTGRRHAWAGRPSRARDGTKEVDAGGGLPRGGRDSTATDRGPSRNRPADDGGCHEDACHEDACHAHPSRGLTLTGSALGARPCSRRPCRSALSLKARWWTA